MIEKIRNHHYTTVAYRVTCFICQWASKPTLSWEKNNKRRIKHFEFHQQKGKGKK